MKFEVTDFVKRLAPESMALILERYPIELSEDWVKASSRKRSMKEFIDAFLRLDENTQERLGGLLREIEIVGGCNRYATMILATLGDRKVELTPEESTALTAMPVADRACWCKLRLSSDVWEVLLTRASQAQRPAKEWKSFALSFSSDPKLGVFTDHKERLEKEVSNVVVATEYRGHHCESDAYQIDNCEYILFDLSDNPSTRKALNDAGDAFETLKKRMAFQIVCRFDHTNHRLSILHQDEIASPKDLSEAVVKTAFGDDVDDMKQVCYNLTYFRDKSTITSGCSDFGFANVKVLRLELWLNGSKNSRRSYYERNADIQLAIAQEIANDVRDSATVNLVQLCFEPIGGSGRPKCLEVSTNSIRNITQQPIDFQRRVVAFLESCEGVVLPKHNE